MIEQENVTLNRIIMLVLLCYPALLLTIRGGMNVLFLLLLLASSLSLYLARNASAAKHWDKSSIAFSLAMASPILAIFLSQAYHGEFKFSSYDWAARFLLAIPVFLALRRINLRAVAMLHYGAPIGALAGLALLVFRPHTWSENVFTTGPFLNLIHFAGLALILGFLSLFAINRALHDSLPVLLLKSCGFLAGLYMALQTGERGAWVAIPALVSLWIYGQGMAHPGRKLGIALLLLVIASVLAYNGIGLIHQRVDMIYQNLVDYGNGHKDTSVGIRLQLWQAALHLFLQNPLFGLGPEGYAKMMPLLAEQGMITPSAAALGQGEVHNELLAKSAGLGIFGLFSIIAVHLVPMVILWHSLNARDARAKVASLMGLALVSGFFIFGLTAEIFNLKMTAAFYALTLAVLMAAATNRNEGH